MSATRHAQKSDLRRACVLAAGLAAPLLVMSGCGHFGILVKKNEPQQEQSPVDASLTALSTDRNPVEAADPIADQPAQTAAAMNIEESARLLEQYVQGIEEAPTSESFDQDLSEDSSEDPFAQDILSEPQTESTAPVLGAETNNSNTPMNNGIGETDGEDLSFSLADAGADTRAEDPASSGLLSDDVSASSETETEQTDTSESVAVDPETRKAQLIEELKELLVSTTRTEMQPAPSAVALAALDALGPGTLESLYEDGVLSSSEMTTLGAAREVLRSIASSGSIASPSEIADVLERVRNELDPSAGMRVTNAILCTRVEGFGRYEQFQSSEFLAGVAHRVIVYVEVDRFAHHEVVDEYAEPRYDVEMSQRLELYHVADDVNTWNRAAEHISERSRNKVRDFYLTNTITLPSTLRAGSYHLKVVMRDKVGQSVAERIIPLRIVAR